jgi:hypothetical protein
VTAATRDRDIPSAAAICCSSLPLSSDVAHNVGVIVMTTSRDTKLLREHLTDIEDALRRQLAPWQRHALEAEEQAIVELLDRIEKRDFSEHVAALRD